MENKKKMTCGVIIFGRDNQYKIKLTLSKIMLMKFDTHFK